MHNLIFLILLVFVGCGKKPEVDNHVYAPLLVEGNSFSEVKNPILKNAVETSLVTLNSDIVLIADIGMNGNLSINNKTIASDSRFSYIMEYQSTYYNFVKRGNDIFLLKSSNLLNWELINNGQPVLTAQAGTIYKDIWNVGVAVDDNGVWHLLVEAAANGNENAGLAYSTATMTNDMINFDTNKSASFVIDHAGNPWLGNVPCKGIVVVYGKQATSIGSYNGEWYVTAGKFQNGVWSESPSFRIGKPSLAVCDPAVLETANGLIMNVSYDQYSIYQLTSNQTLSELFDTL